MTDTPLPSPDTAADPATEDLPELPETQHDPHLWRDDGWTARVIKNEDDDGWAVEMIKDGEPEPALVGPWTMGRDKKNPKPLDTGDKQKLDESFFSNLAPGASFGFKMASRVILACP